MTQPVMSRIEQIERAIRVRKPTIDVILLPDSASRSPEDKLLRAYDILVNYTKAMALGDKCPNPLDRAQSRA